MTPNEFCYWLQGFMEVADPGALSEKQTQQIKDHLALVFKKVTPERSADPVQICSQEPRYIKPPVRLCAATEEPAASLGEMKFC